MPIIDEIILLIRTVVYLLSAFFLKLGDLVSDHPSFVVLAIVIVLALRYPVIVVALAKILYRGLYWQVRFLADPRRTLDILAQRHFERSIDREMQRSIERRAAKPAPELVDELTWLYRQSTLIAEGAITREGENRAVKEYQAMIKAENTWRAENGLELVEDVTAEPKPIRHRDYIVIRKESGEHVPECPCSNCDRQCT